MKEKLCISIKVQNKVSELTLLLDRHKNILNKKNKERFLVTPGLYENKWQNPYFGHGPIEHTSEKAITIFVIGEEKVKSFKRVIKEKRLFRKPIYENVEDKQGKIQTYDNIAATLNYELKTIDIMDDRIYPVLKEFGQKNKFKELYKCWMGAEC